MATRFATGMSSGKDSGAVAVEAVRQAREKIEGDRVDLSMVYCSGEYNYKEVVDAVREATNNAPLIGASSAGEFTEKKSGTGNIAVGLLRSDDIKVFTALSEGVKQDPETAIKKVAASLPNRVEGYPHLTAIVLIDGLVGVGEEITLLASYILGNEIKIVGGMAGDDFNMEKTFVFVDERVCTNAFGVCLLASKMPVFSCVEHGHVPLSRPLKATRAEGNVLYQINNRPAWDVWKEETAGVAKDRGIDVEQIRTPAEVARFFANYILGLATEKEGRYKIRWPVSINDHGSLNFTCGIAQGAVFRIMDGSDLDRQIRAGQKAIRAARESAENAGYSEVAGILVFDCAVRQLMLGDRFSESVASLKGILPGVPLLGWETYGEIRLEPGRFSGFHNSSSVVLLIPNFNKTA